MSIFNGFNASASGLTAQRLRMDVISSNMANSETTRARVNENGEHEPYRRKLTTFAPIDQSFQSHLRKAKDSNQSNGVKVSNIIKDQTPFKQAYNPNHPDANIEGYVELPNVDPLKETVDLMSATRSYEANITALNASKSILMKALEIGK